MSGLLLGNGLLKNNVDFSLYEADSEFSERDGYQIRLGAPALVGFRACLDDDLSKTLYSKFGRSGGVVSAAPALYDSSLNMLLDFSKFPAYTKSAPITRVMLRNTLSAPLKRQGKISYDKKFTRYECIDASSEKPQIKVFFEDGTDDVCDLLVSAEGARSKVNAQIGLNNIIYLPQHRNLSAKCSVSREKILELRPEARRGAPIAVSKDGLFFFFSAYIPDQVDGSDEEASIFWSLIVPAEEVPDTVANGTQREKLQFCCDKVQDWDPTFQSLLRVVGDSEIRAFRHHTSTEPPKDWRSKAKSQGRAEIGSDHVWLIGDAIHPMTPTRGMGANQAMCDTADILPNIVALARTKERTEADYSFAVEKYESAMFPRAFAWVRTSGGTDQSVVDASTWTGVVTIFFMARALDLAYAFGWARAALGWVPQDDAPELR
ncbi:hypothetical protein E8E14_014667 [Neopestalotiopsis sp. 37M]|nr:hypothetical protein E8E14_014667 [Neopestalotiopsis sp. 37M]